jgi:hypothetical protein
MSLGIAAREEPAVSPELRAVAIGLGRIVAL